MLDLDTLELFRSQSGPNTLYIQFAQWLCMEKINYVEFQKLSKWTNTYHYVLPDSRQMDRNLRDYLYTLHGHQLFSLALLVSHIESNLRPEHQLLLLERLEKSGVLDGKNA